MKKILIVGNLGYIGPVLVSCLRQHQPDLQVIGYDTGYFEGCLINHVVDNRFKADVQLYGDVRSFDPSILQGVSTVIYLAAISNDPMGNVFESQTIDINKNSALNFANSAREAGVESFVFASSCSSYGFGGDEAKSENDSVNPLTAYAISKVEAESELSKIASDDFRISCLRFATACGSSPRLRLDLVLNDFVASALLNSNITILSDGSPLRPLIDVEDMCRAIMWAMDRPVESGGPALVVNAGCNEWNFSVLEIAEYVKEYFGNIDVKINEDAEPDKRSYKVDFSLYKQLSGESYPEKTLADSIGEIAQCIESSDFDLSDFRNSHFMRLNALRHLQDLKSLDSDLYWRRSV
jgi:nucleoside-diphosphate-sugar epimerase